MIDFRIINLMVLTIGILYISSKIRAALSGKKLINQWAIKNNFNIIKARFCWIITGPFFYGKTGAVFRLTVEDISGNQKKGWVKVRNFLFREPESVLVRWDEEVSSIRRFVEIFLLLILLIGIAFFIAKLGLNYYQL